MIEKQEQERRGRQYHDRRKESCEDDDRPPPGVVQAAKQSYLHKTKTPETRSEVVLYNEGQEDRGKLSSEKVILPDSFILFSCRQSVYLLCMKITSYLYSLLYMLMGDDI